MILMGRTKVSMRFNLDTGKRENEPMYECIDCHYKTADADLMTAHQETYKHNLWQRIKRGLCL